VLPVDVLQGDPADRVPANEERHIDRRFHWLALEHRAADLLDPLRHPVVDDDRLACLEDVLRHTHDLERLIRQSHPALDRISGVHEPGLVVDQRDVDHLRIEDLLDAIPDQVVHRLHLEVLRQPALHVVDECQLGVPLPGLFEQPRVLERDAQASGDRGEEADVAIAECELAVHVL
jgi:hypothetical protein